MTSGTPHTAQPASSVSLKLRSFTDSLNGRWGDEDRKRLAPFLPRMVGTKDDGQEDDRLYLALDWMVRTYAPAWLDLAGCAAEATAVRDLPRVVDYDTAQRVRPVVQAAQVKVSGIWDAEQTPTWKAAIAVAWEADRDAGGALIPAVVGRAASMLGISDAALGAANSAAFKAADGTTTWGDAWSAAQVALRPTVKALQTSVLDLLDRMIDP